MQSKDKKKTKQKKAHLEVIRYVDLTFFLIRNIDIDKILPFFFNKFKNFPSSV